MIGAERANAIKVAARLLWQLSRACGIRLSEIRGGGLIHVIPRECAAVFAATPDLEVLREVLSGLMRQIHAEYAETDPGMEMVLERADAGETAWTTEADSRRLLDFLYLLPVGAQKRTAGKYEQVEGSFNLSILQFQNGTLDCDLVCRSNYPVSIEELWQTAQAYGEQFHVDGRMTMDYAGYHVPTDSPLIRLWAGAGAYLYALRTGRRDHLRAAGHFGYDCGHAHRAGCTYPTGAYECGFFLPHL